MKMHDTIFDGEFGGLTSCLMKFEVVDGIRRRVHTSRVEVAETRLEWDESCRNGKACRRCMDHHARIFVEMR